MQTNQNKSELTKLLSESLVSLPAEHTPPESILRLVIQPLSFETIMAISKDLVDYRFLARYCWILMVKTISNDSGILVVIDDMPHALPEDKARVLRTLCLFSLKFPEYLSKDDLNALVHNIIPSLEMRRPENSEEEFYDRTKSYLRNFHTLLTIKHPVHPDICGYYTPEASAIRMSGICSKLIRAAFLYIKNE